MTGHPTRTGPDLLDLLAEHAQPHDVTCCDHRAGYLNGLRRAAAFVQDYGHTSPRVDVVRIQGAILRAVEIAECDDCNRFGCVVRDDGRSVEHHAIGGE